ncbi:hypothetical protein FQR65_LT11496 [Abscondita terminalis]|nr:hypothetical protein FQR65_LT11496 [Abscondita terminalis]
MLSTIGNHFHLCTSLFYIQQTIYLDMGYIQNVQERLQVENHNITSQFYNQLSFRGMKFVKHTKKQISRLRKNHVTVPKQFLETVEKNQHKVALIFEKEKWTFNELEDFSNQIANVFSVEGFVKGECVGLFYENRPEFVGIIIGLSKLGVITALINTNLISDSLVHCVTIAKCKGLIFGASLSRSIANVESEIENIKLYQMPDTIECETLKFRVNDLKKKTNRASKVYQVVKEEIEANDLLFYIYTSGTTGPPKAAVLKHIRCLAQSNIVNYVFNQEAILYNPLPLYHALGLLGISLLISQGITVVIRKKFSASQYWEECEKHDCTHAFYIGEMCRYILNSPNLKVPNHKVTKIIGNGLKADVWQKFTKKFNIKDVYEFYTSTEGNIVLANLDNKVGAIGFIPFYMQKRHPMQLIKFDEEDEEPLRDQNGFCLRCKTKEPGLAIGKINNDSVMANFQGYLDKAQTSKKILQNVFEPGDFYFNSGDILEYDELGYIYFKDRTGDTFRWKGENVSTFEVESVISKYCENNNAVVIGVEVPNTEGRCGMAIIASVNKIFDVNVLSEGLLESLPKYAIPLFIRIVNTIPVTNTFKVQKVELKKQGYNWYKIKDHMYFFNQEINKYVRGMKLLKKLKKSMATVKKHNLTVHKEFFKTFQKHSNKVAIIFEQQRWTFAMMEDYSNKIGNYFNLEGYKKGDCIGLLCNNRPEYVCIWLGLSKFGICTALINTNLVCDSLVHSLDAGNCSALIFESSFANSVLQILSQVSHLRLYQLDDSDTKQEMFADVENLSTKLSETPATPIEIHDYVNYKDPLLYIYTSGTTGLPKAAIISQLRYLTLQSVVGFFNDEEGIFYNPMPLYHLFGVMGVAFCFGTTAVIKKKFSASQYWDDCAKYDCTAAMYIGEMCRYILNVPDIKTPKHKVKRIVGNGLKADIWRKFVEKFHVDEVLEFYTSTEGVIIFVNLDNKVGSIGFIPRYVRSTHPTQLVKYNEKDEEPIRDPNGLCIPSKIGEPGLALGKIDDNYILTTFQGYTDEKQSQKKIIKDVIEFGDTYFNSGDILECDEFGYIYFKDRIGDTFRWKGENVSTFEVESVLSKLTANVVTIVFGVEVPGTEGRAGMAVLGVDEKEINLDNLATNLLENLPKYAVPVFIRFTKNLLLTSTYKIIKMSYKAQGYDLDEVTDPIYILDPSFNKYVPLTRELYEDIAQCRLRI